MIFRDSNTFEEKLSQVRIDDAINPAHKHKLKKEMLSAFEQARAVRKAAGFRIWPVVFKAAAVLVFAAVLAGVFLLNGNDPADIGGRAQDPRGEQAVPMGQGEETAGGDKTALPESAGERLDREFAQIDALYQAGDVEGLMRMLTAGQDLSRQRAANYLTQIGDAETLAKLEEMIARESDPEQQKLLRSTAMKLAESLEQKEEQDQTEPGASAGSGSVDLLPTAPGSTVITVVHRQTGEPVENAEVRYNYRGLKEAVLLSTNVNGQCRIDWAGVQSPFVRIRVYRPDFVPLIESLYDEKDAVPNVRQAYTVSLEPGMQIGGKVVNEENEPVEGATVFINIYDEDTKIFRANIRDRKVTTDANGEWVFGLCPARYQDAAFKLSHPDYADDNWMGSRRAEESQLRGKSVVWVMERGVNILGRVVNTAGNPIQNADIYLGDDRFGDFPTAKSDAFGRFEFKNFAAGQVTMTVQAAGYAPESLAVAAVKSPVEVEVMLQPGSRVYGQVVDKNGVPRAGVKVYAETWRGHRALRWETSTDSQGRFVWNEAPADEVLLDISGANCMRVRDYPVVPSDREYVITMYDALKVHGRVTDARTGETIPAFTAIKGLRFRNNETIHWQRSGNPDDQLSFTNGSYTMVYTFSYPELFLRIEAPGYLPAVSQAFYGDEEDLEVDFALTKGEGLKGYVMKPDETPAEGARIAIAAVGGHVQVTNGELDDRRDYIILTADEKGMFSLPPQDDRYKLAIVHESGWAEVTPEEFEADAHIRLKAWGRLDGTLYVEGRPGAGEKISGYYQGISWEQGQPNISWSLSANTDGEGCFAFEHVKPGLYSVGRLIKVTQSSWTTTNTSRVEVLSGGTADVVLGLTGRPVIGRLVAPEGVEIYDWNMGHRNISSYMTPQKAPEVDIEYPIPPNIEAMSLAEIKAFYENWQKSDAFKEYQKKVQEQYNKANQQKDLNQKRYTFMAAPDGTFRIEDVEPGDYSLRVEIYEPEANGNYDFQKPLGRIDTRFSVPDMPEGYMAEPLDIGEVQLQSRRTQGVQPGESFGSLKMTTLEGASLDLAQYKGRHVLLHLWTPMGPDQPEVTAANEMLREMSARYDESELVIIGLCPYLSRSSLNARMLEMQMVLGRKYIQENELSGVNAYPSADQDTTEIFQRLGIQKFPANFLIGPEGIVIERDMTAEQMHTAIEQALSAAGVY